MTPIEDVKQRALIEIDSAASKIRLKYTTALYGLELVYAEKINEAIDFAASNYSDEIRKYPLLEAEATATNKSPKLVAQQIMFKKSQWVKNMSNIEFVRLGGKHKIHQVTSIAEISEILSQTLAALQKL